MKHQLLIITVLTISRPATISQAIGYTRTGFFWINPSAIIIIHDGKPCFVCFSEYKFSIENDHLLFKSFDCRRPFLAIFVFSQCNTIDADNVQVAIFKLRYITQLRFFIYLVFFWMDRWLRNMKRICTRVVMSTQWRPRI